MHTNSVSSDWKRMLLPSVSMLMSPSPAKADRARKKRLCTMILQGVPARKKSLPIKVFFTSWRVSVATK